jgi:hypothetical protein
MGEHHRAKEPDPAGDPHGRQKGEGLKDPDREEEDGERLRRGVVLARKQVGDEGLRHEAPAEAVEGEQAREAHHDAARAVQRRQRLLLELVAALERR